MALIDCPECSARISDKAAACPKCGNPMKPVADLTLVTRRLMRGYEWKSKTEIFGWPLIHIAVGRNKETGRLMMAKGIIAIGQFGIGVITIAQFGIGLLFGLGQFVGGIFAVGHFAFGIYFGLGQFATGITAIGQFAFGRYVRAQAGYGRYVWAGRIKDYEAVEYFRGLWQPLKNLIGR
ncbi:hypothetical protein ACFL6S_04430 [Candidatus Poribacteria bacterium]